MTGVTGVTGVSGDGGIPCGGGGDVGNSFATTVMGMIRSTDTPRELQVKIDTFRQDHFGKFLFLLILAKK